MVDINEIKRCTLQAMMKDDLLMQGLVLKGGNALQLAYDITNRGSIDIDFSMENEFKDKDFERLSRVFSEYLNEEFAEIGLVAYDVKFIKKPKTGSIPEWRGYNLEFKLIEREKFEKFGDDIEAIRRNAIKINESTQEVKYTVDISSYEYVDKAIKKDIDGLILIFKREFPCLQAGDDSVSFRLSFGLQYIFLLFLPIYDQRTLQNRILSRGMVNDYATMEIRSVGRRMNIPSTD